MKSAVCLLLAVPIACLAYAGLLAAIGGTLRVLDPRSFVGDVLGSVFFWISPLALGWLVLVVLWAGCVWVLRRATRGRE